MAEVDDLGTSRHSGIFSRLLNSRKFCERKRRSRCSNERSGASVERAREKGGGRGARLENFLASHVPRAIDHKGLLESGKVKEVVMGSF